jgi:hypothetical protein
VGSRISLPPLFSRPPYLESRAIINSTLAFNDNLVRFLIYEVNTAGTCNDEYVKVLHVAMVWEKLRLLVSSQELLPLKLGSVPVRGRICGVSLVLNCFPPEAIIETLALLEARGLEIPYWSELLNTDSDLMANMYIVLNCRRKLLEHAYGYYGMELKLAFSSL